jgi:hypothetical protein
MKKTEMKLQAVELTLEEWRAATRPNVYRNKKKYRRKTKHKGRDW